MFLNIIGICIGACIALLTVYSSVQARNHTTPIIISTSTGAPTTGGAVSGYNSSASAVSAIWLFANIYFVNALRTSRPQLQLPVIMYSIFAMISATYAPSFPTMSAGISFVERLLEAFTLAFAISTGVNFFVFPMTCRGVFFKQSAGMIGVLQGALIAQKEYVQSLEKEDMFKDPSADLVLMPDDKDEELKGHEAKHHHFHKEKKPERPVIPPQAKLKAMIAAIGGLQGQMYADISFAKREVAYGKLDASDIDEIHHHIRDIILPIYGMSSVADIFGRVAEKRGWVEGPEAARMAAATKDDPNHDLKKAKIKQWNEVMRILHVPFETMTAAMCEGLQHVSFVLELTKPPEASKRSKTYDAATAATGDEEADAGMVKPGDLRFSKHLKERIDGFYAQRQSSLTSFMQEMGDGDDFSSPKKTLETGRRMSMVGGEHSEAHKRNQRQLYMVLYMQFLLFSIGRAVLKFVEYADRRVEEGAMKKNRFILPGNRRLRKWVLGLWKKEDMSSSESTPDSAESGGAGIYSGSSFQTQLDPEHLPPANTWERATDVLRGMSRGLGSMESSFGFRVACATLTIGIVAYLKTTQVFFMEQRLVWAMIMVAIGELPLRKRCLSDHLADLTKA